MIVLRSVGTESNIPIVCIMCVVHSDIPSQKKKTLLLIMMAVFSHSTGMVARETESSSL